MVHIIFKMFYQPEFLVQRWPSFSTLNSHTTGDLAAEIICFSCYSAQPFREFYERICTAVFCLAHYYRNAWYSCVSGSSPIPLEHWVSVPSISETVKWIEQIGMGHIWLRFEGKLRSSCTEGMKVAESMLRSREGWGDISQPASLVSSAFFLLSCRPVPLPTPGCPGKCESKLPSLQEM